MSTVKSFPRIRDVELTKKKYLAEARKGLLDYIRVIDINLGFSGVYGYLADSLNGRKYFGCTEDYSPEEAKATINQLCEIYGQRPKKVLTDAEIKTERESYWKRADACKSAIESLPVNKLFYVVDYLIKFLDEPELLVSDPRKAKLLQSEGLDEE